MGGRDARHPTSTPPIGRGHRLLLRLPTGLVLAVLAAAGVSYAVVDHPDPATDPAAVAPPPGLTLPAVPAPPTVARTAAGTPDPARVRRALAPLLRDRDLGPHVVATVASLDGRLLYSRGSGVALPASTLKLLTSTAALETLGPDHTFSTRVVADGRRGVVLVGGGDPLLASKPNPGGYPHTADVVTLARDTARELKADGRTRVRLGYDDSLFSGPAVDPRWPATYVPEDVVSPISALWVDEGRSPSGYGRVDDPPAAAAATFAAALQRAGVKVDGEPRRRTAAAGARELAAVSSPPLSQIVEHTVSVSDNEAAEVLARQVGLAVSGEGTFAAGARDVLATLERLGVPVADATTYDGSGLSRQDRLDPRTLTAVLALVASDDHPQLRPVLTGLPVAGFSGSLTDRFEVGAADGRGVVRAKTGTLTGVSGLAGIVTDRGGRPMVFAVLSDRIRVVDTLDARASLDRITSALAGCRCG